MEFGEALELVVGRTGHARFYQLTDPTHPDYDPGYVRVVMAMAQALSPPDRPAVVYAHDGVSLVTLGRVPGRASWTGTAVRDATCGPAAIVYALAHDPGAAEPWILSLSVSEGPCTGTATLTRYEAMAGVAVAGTFEASGDADGLLASLYGAAPAWVCISA